MSKHDVLMLECLNGSKQAFCVILIDEACGRSQGGKEEKWQRMKFLQAALKLLCCVATSSDVPSQLKLYNKWAVAAHWCSLSHWKFTVPCNYSCIQESIHMITRKTNPNPCKTLCREQVVKDWMKMQIYNQKFNRSWHYWWIKTMTGQREKKWGCGLVLLGKFRNILPTGQHDEHHIQVSWGSRTLLLMRRSYMQSFPLHWKLSQLIKILWQSQSFLKPEVNIWIALQKNQNTDLCVRVGTFCQWYSNASII